MPCPWFNGVELVEKCRTGSIMQVVALSRLDKFYGVLGAIKLANVPKCLCLVCLFFRIADVKHPVLNAQAKEFIPSEKFCTQTEFEPSSSIDAAATTTTNGKEPG